MYQFFFFFGSSISVFELTSWRVFLFSKRTVFWTKSKTFCLCFFSNGKLKLLHQKGRRLAALFERLLFPEKICKSSVFLFLKYFACRYERDYLARESYHYINLPTYESKVILKIDIPYAHHYNPRLVKILPHFSVQFIIKSG